MAKAMAKRFYDEVTVEEIEGAWSGENFGRVGGPTRPHQPEPYAGHAPRKCCD